MSKAQPLEKQKECIRVPTPNILCHTLEFIWANFLRHFSMSSASLCSCVNRLCSLIVYLTKIVGKKPVEVSSVAGETDKPLDTRYSTRKHWAARIVKAHLLDQWFCVFRSRRRDSCVQFASHLHNSSRFRQQYKCHQAPAGVFLKLSLQVFSWKVSQHSVDMRAQQASLVYATICQAHVDVLRTWSQALLHARRSVW